MISIIVPTYNRLEVLKRCLGSMIPQHYPGLEIIVIDDFSTDNTRSYLTGLAAEYPFVKLVFNEKNCGVNYARNRGIEVVSNPYLMFIDSDDKLIDGCIKKILEALETSKGRSHYLFLLEYRCKEYETLEKPAEIFYENWVKGNISGDFTHVVLTSIFKEFMFFEQFRMFEQLNWFRIFKATSPQLLIPVAVAEIDLGRSDSLSVSQKLKSKAEVEAKFLSEFFFYQLFYDDLEKFNPSFLVLPLLKNVFLGVACNKRKETKLLIGYANKWYVKFSARLLTIIPSSLALWGITGFSNIKRNWS